MPSPAPPRRTQVERRNDSEEALLEAAAEVVAERGVERASLASIGERAGTSRGLPTHHFGSKDALVARLVQRAQNQIDEAAWAAATELEGEVADHTAVELIRSTVDTYLARFEHPNPNDIALIVLWGSTFPAEASKEGLSDADRRSFDGWASLIEQGQKDGSIKTEIDPRSSAILLQAFIRGVAATVLTHAELPETRSLRGACQDWITAALTPAGS